MKRLFVKCVDGSSTCIEADSLMQLHEDVNFIIAKKDDSIVGVFDLGSISVLYLSESGSKS